MRTCNDYMVIPVSLCQYALSNRIFRTFQVLIALKCYSSGRTKVDKSIIKFIASEINVSDRTIRNELEKLYNDKWVGKKGNIYYIRSFSYIQKQIQSDSRTGVKFHIDDLKKFKAFIIGATLSYWVQIQWLKAKKNKAMGRRPQTMGRGTSSRNIAFRHFPIANSIITRFIGCSMGTASKYKQIAYLSNYIDIIKQYTILKNVPVENYQLCKENNPEISHLLTIKNGKVAITETDLIAPLVSFKKRGKEKK